MQGLQHCRSPTKASSGENVQACGLQSNHRNFDLLCFVESARPETKKFLTSHHQNASMMTLSALVFAASLNVS
jgi:hypothetical protein